MINPDVIISGGGIGGLTLALTLHQIGVSCRVVEASRTMQPLGVGINIQPNAVRELYDLGFTKEDLDRIGVSAREWALLGLNGKEVYTEPRGIAAGYQWPQYATHRGEFHMMLYNKVLERLGPDALLLGTRVTGYDCAGGKATVHLLNKNQTTSEQSAKVLIAADGIHSHIRAQMHPLQPPIHWGGAVMWRGTVRAKPMRTGSSFIGLGTDKHRVVIYPISAPDSEGNALINWIAEVTRDNFDGWSEQGWFRPVPVKDFIHHFNQFKYDWLDVPEMLCQTKEAYENPMIDRDPVSTWVDGPVALMGDAAHAMYPTGSNGASQAIIDARVIGAKFLQYGINPTALSAYNSDLCEPISKLVLRNRGAGPFGLLKLLDVRCGGIFEDVNTVIPTKEREEFMAEYKEAAGFSRDTLNKAGPTIQIGRRH
ncbi:MAG: flavin-dependent oxidoreductase, partial [Planktomarina sp.]|nr:flavin-dependent oxidoreductase [Planktomarina sp.]